MGYPRERNSGGTEEDVATKQQAIAEISKE